MCLYKAPSDTPRWQENNNKTESVGACTRCPLPLIEASRIAHHRKNEQHQKPTL